MAQGKTKVKSKLPAGVKNNKAKGRAVTKRKNAPVKSKNSADKSRMKGQVSRMVNAAAEEQLRAMAKEGPKQLSEAQKRVATAPTAPAPSKT